MRDTLKGRTALITGCSRGIGEAIARRFAAEGATVVVTARTVEPGTGRLAGSLAELVAAIEGDGGRAIPMRLDVADPASRAAVADAVLAQLGGVDILVNNAATDSFGKSWRDIDRRRFDKLMEVNVLAPLDMMQRLVPGMVQRGRGWVLNITSKTAELPQGPDFNAFETGSGVMLYGTSKATLNRMSAGIAAELAGSGVAINALAPFSIVFTPGTAAVPGIRDYRGLPGWVEEPVEGMAEAALALCSGDPARVTGLVVYSTDYLRETGRHIHTLDGRDLLRDWKPIVD
jgi:NAD(P)-dependent dehydrogenase (short-subunit alcohol dehydrogenase family)